MERKLKLSANGDRMKDKTTFEENLKRLGEIASELEKGSLTLEKAVELYSESAEVALLCRKQLDEAKIKITEVGREILPEK